MTASTGDGPQLYIPPQSTSPGGDSIRARAAAYNSTPAHEKASAFDRSAFDNRSSAYDRSAYDRASDASSRGQDSRRSYGSARTTMSGGWNKSILKENKEEPTGKVCVFVVCVRVVCASACVCVCMTHCANFGVMTPIQYTHI